MDPCSLFTAGVGPRSVKAFREQRLLTEDKNDVTDCKVLAEKMESIQNMCPTEDTIP